MDKPRSPQFQIAQTAAGSTSPGKTNEAVGAGGDVWWWGALECCATAAAMHRWLARMGDHAADVARAHRLQECQPGRAMNGVKRIGSCPSTCCAASSWSLALDRVSLMVGAFIPAKCGRRLDAVFRALPFLTRFVTRLRARLFF